MIVAAATPWARSALAVVRFSGVGLDTVLARILRPLGSAPLRPGVARRVAVVDASGTIDDGVAVLQRGPRSYTGEDTLDLTLHGNPLVVEQVLAAAVDAGARLAEAGAFTRRALEHGKLDLLGAEAVDQVSRARTAEGLQIARAGLDGALTDFAGGLRDALLDVAAELEAQLDLPGEGLFEGDGSLCAQLRARSEAAGALAATFGAGRVLVEGARVAIVGPVNAGKSSLFNALLGRTRALVHEAPGTTRDVVEGRCRLDGLELTLLDTAGERATDDPVEAAGLALAQELVADADVLLVVLRAGAPGAVEARILDDTAHRRRLVLYNGIDRPDAGAPPLGALPISARTGAGLPELRRALRSSLLEGAPRAEGLCIASARQRDVLRSVERAAAEAASALPLAGPAVAAEYVAEALGSLDALTGADTREDVLSRLFARFCIGK